MIGRTLRDDAFNSARRRVVLLWKPMATWTVLVWVLLVATLAPLTSALLGRQVLGSEQVWGNEELLRWLISPVGLFYALMTGSIALTAAVVRFAGLFRIVTDHIEGRTPSATQTLKELVPQIPALFRVTVFTVTAAGVLLVPLALALFGVYGLFLTEYDINYYLESRPREIAYAVVSAGLIGLVWAVAAGRLAIRSVPALPAYLDGHRPLTVAIRRGWERTRDSAGRMIRVFSLSLGLWLIARAVAASTSFYLAQTAVEALAAATDSLTLIILATGAYTVGTLALDAVISFAGFSLLSTVLVKFYYEDTDLHEKVPKLPGLGALSMRAARAVVGWVGRGRVAILAALILFVGLLATGAFINPAPPPGPVEVIAHRAGPSLAPENSLLALDRAIDAGADWVEIDVQRTVDSVLVVVHDADLMRVAGSSQRIQGARSESILGQTLGTEAGVAPEDLQVALLSDFLDRARGRVQVMIELKYYGRDPLLARLVVDEVRRLGMEDQVAFMSLDVGAVRELADLAPETPRGYLSAASVGSVTRLPVDFVAVALPRLTPALVRTAHASGQRVYAWTLNDPGTMVSAVDLGVDGIITDDPVLARRVLGELAALSPAGRVMLRFRNLVDAPE
ncbi:MAG: hypothetical protein HKN29_00245 [Rhodothermales bacterium]|nr:hypothetical protein [Rhodothermales bacterium]